MELKKRIDALSLGVEKLVEKSNSCHNQSDGRFCSGGSGSGGKIDGRKLSNRYAKKEFSVSMSNLENTSEKKKVKTIAYNPDLATYKANQENPGWIATHARVLGLAPEES